MQFFLGGGGETGLQLRFLKMKKSLELRKGVLFPLFGRGFFFLQMRHSSARRQSTLNDESCESSNFHPYSLISVLFGSCRLSGAETISAFAGAPLTVTNLSTAASTVVISACCASGKLGCQKAWVLHSIDNQLLWAVIAELWHGYIFKYILQHSPGCMFF